MEDLSKIGSFALLGDADPVPQSLFLSHPEQANTLALLYEVSREVTSILEREELLRRVAERIKKIVKYDVFSVMLWNEQSQHLESVFSMRCGDSLPARSRIPLHKGLTGTAAGERRVLRINDVTDDARYIRCESGVQVRSELVVPLLLRDRLIGVLDLESSEPHAFTLEHERMLSTLGSLPNGAREVPGLDLAAAYVPAHELGGDFYDFLPYGKGRLGFALGDVSGKGTAAALYGSLAIGILREHVVTHLCPPAEMLATLNRRLYNDRFDSRFIAMLFATYDAPSRSLTLANAGGPYPLLVRGGCVQPIRLEGVPLGLIPNSEYDETTVELTPGDVVLFASDGILESENSTQEEFGPKRLFALLSGLSHEDSAQEIAEQILAATDGHSGAGTAPHDDRTLVVLRVTNDSSSDFSKLPIIY